MKDQIKQLRAHGVSSWCVWVTSFQGLTFGVIITWMMKNTHVFGRNVTKCDHIQFKLKFASDLLHYSSKYSLGGILKPFNYFKRPHQS